MTQPYGATLINFDGYSDDPTTEDAIHLRRKGDCVGVTMHVACGMMINSKKDGFLNGKANKHSFILHYLMQWQSREFTELIMQIMMPKFALYRQLFHLPDAKTLF